MDNATYVERYAWFGAMRNLQGVNPANALLDGKGNITALGKQYIGGGNAATNGTTSGNGADRVLPPALAAVILMILCGFLNF